MALDHGLRSVGLPALDVLSLLLAPPHRILVHEDNQVAVRIVRTGRNQTMRYLNRTHGVSVAWIHERYLAGDFEIQWEASDGMAADVFTKAFSNPLAWDAACWLVGVVDDARVAERCCAGDAPPPTSQGGGKERRLEA